MNSEPETYGLTLSGGGFRATFFHLGVVEELGRLGVLPSVRHISGVSGGAITAAHVWLNWDQILETSGNIDECFSQLTDFADTNVQARLIRRKLFRMRSSGELLEEAYSTIFRRKQLNQSNPVGWPRLSVLATDLESGLPVAFDSEGVFRVINGTGPDIGMPQPLPSVRTVTQCRGHHGVTIAKAVAASSAYPALVSLVDVPELDLRHLTDGGVYDNLGIMWMDSFVDETPGKRAFNHLLVSDAGGRRNFRSSEHGPDRLPFENFVFRNTSAIDLVMRHLDEARHDRRLSARTYFHISEDAETRLGPEHPALVPTTLNGLGADTYAMLRKHGNLVALREWSRVH